MFRFTEHREVAYDWSHWLDWFASLGVHAEVRLHGGQSSVWREGADAVETGPNSSARRVHLRLPASEATLCGIEGAARLSIMLDEVTCLHCKGLL